MKSTIELTVSSKDGEFGSNMKSTIKLTISSKHSEFGSTEVELERDDGRGIRITASLIAWLEDKVIRLFPGDTITIEEIKT